MNRLFTALFISTFLIFPVKDHYLSLYKTEAKIISFTDSTSSVSISFVGDLMCHSVQYNYARVSKDSFDFVPVYRYVSSLLSEADITIGNLETVTAGKSKGYSGYPFFNSPDAYVTALKVAGFDLLTTSNNHSMDRGEFGVLRTIDILTQNELHYNGTYKSQADRDSIRIFEINNLRIAFLAYTYGTNGIAVPSKKKYLINLIDLKQIESDIIKAKSKNCDAIIVHYHFGDEYKREPNKYQKEIVQKTIEFGADIIIGGHPHVLQPANYIESNDANLDSVFVAYSLGNFISNQRWRYSDAGLILNFTIEKNHTSNKVSLQKVDYIPTWVYKGNTGSKNEYVILPSESFDDSTILFLSNKHGDLMQQAFNDSKEIITKYSEIKCRSIVSKPLLTE